MDAASTMPERIAAAHNAVVRAEDVSVPSLDVATYGVICAVCGSCRAPDSTYLDYVADEV
jgi:hypothetical protein